jgi:signal transduction histidine kinase
MRRRILVAILSVTTIAVALFGVPLAIVIERFVDESATLRIERQAVLAARTVPGDFATSNDPVELPPTSNGIDLALYDEHGTLITGIGPAKADATTVQALGNRVTDSEGSGRRIVAVPVAADEQVVGAIRADQSTASSDARSRRLVALLALLAIGVITIGAAIGYLVAGRLARPVRRLRDAAVQLGEGDFTIDVPRSNVPELDQAAQAMTATAQHLDDLVTRERSFSADASHQLRTPLAGLRAAIETELELPRPDRTEVLHEALGDIDRLERTITELLSIARTSRAVPGPTFLAEVLNDLNATWRGPLAALGRRLSIADAHDCPPVRGNSSMLRHALDVLLDNALQHGAGEVRVEHDITTDNVIISIGDEGPGFTVAPTDELHGHGLQLARRLIEAMPGRLVITRTGPNPRVDVVLQRASTTP